MPNKLKENFQKAGPDNLPELDSFAVAAYFGTRNFLRPEIKQIKLQRSARPTYSDNAVGYVQVKNEGTVCHVCATITPEHRVTKSSYNVHCIIDVKEKEIKEAYCTDCTAANGGCKHAVAFVTWLHRRSEEASVTSKECYWKKSTLATVGSSVKFIKATEISKPTILNESDEKKEVFFEELLSSLKDEADPPLFVRQCIKKPSYSIHHLLLRFLEHTSSSQHDGESFIKFCTTSMESSVINELAEKTSDQSKSPLWFALRYGRITASKVYEAAKCKTYKGSLVNRILGAAKFVDTEAMKRGRKLEAVVLKKVSAKLQLRFKQTGFVMRGDCPVFGASPDALNEDFIIEIKCPTSERTFQTYLSEDKTEPAAKYKSQMMLQMHFCGKLKGFFCVAAPDFEKTKNVEIFNVSFDNEFCKQIMLDAREFWLKAIFPTLIDSFK